MNYEKNNKNMIYVLQLRLISISIILAFVIALFIPYKSNIWNIITTSWVVIFIYTFVFYNPLRIKNYGYYVDKTKVVIKSGVIYKTIKTIATPNIQYIKLSQGIFQRIFGLYTVVIYSAGGVIYVVGIKLDTAHKIQSKICGKAERQE